MDRTLSVESPPRLSLVQIAGYFVRLGERWTTNAESDEALRAEIAARIERLVLELTT